MFRTMLNGIQPGQVLPYGMQFSNQFKDGHLYSHKGQLTLHHLQDRMTDGQFVWLSQNGWQFYQVRVRSIFNSNRERHVHLTAPGIETISFIERSRKWSPEEYLLRTRGGWNHDLERVPTNLMEFGLMFYLYGDHNK